MMWVRINSPVIKVLLSFLLFVSLFGIYASPTPILAAGLSLSSRTPAANALDVINTSNIDVQFNTSINGTTVNENTFNVDGSISGKVSGNYSGGGSSNVTFNPTLDFKAGETITVTLTSGIRGENGATLTNPFTWQFVVEAPQGYANFEYSGQSLGSSDSYDVSLGDVDCDGDLDAFVTNYSGQPNRVWLNDGSGNFTDSGQSLGSSYSHGVSLGDVDGDGDLDAFVNNYLQANRVWLNDGSGNFTDSGQSLGNSYSDGVSLGDVDGDGDLDAFVANSAGQANKVWLNDGNGTFSDSGQSLGSSTSSGVCLGDVDGDGDLDAFVANYNLTPNRVWLNNGSGNFSDSGQSLGSSISNRVCLGDFDGDGDLDAFVANYNSRAYRVWLNNGNGTFTNSLQSLGNLGNRCISLGDVDGDGDLDAFVTNRTGLANKVWLNDGNSNFTGSGQSLGSLRSWGISLGDIDGDGDLDAFVNSRNQANKVWLNEPIGDSSVNLLGIIVTPSFPSIPLGLTEQFTAVSIYTDASTATITDNVTWASSNPGVATVDTAGLATSHAIGTAVIAASLDGVTSLGVTLTVIAEATAEVNLGNRIILSPDGSQSDIPLTINGFPYLGLANGLGSFGFILTWDNTVINVTSVTPATAPPGYIFMSGPIKPGTTKIGGFTSGPPYVSGNLTVAYLTITAVGSVGESTSINVTIDELADARAADPIPATPVNAPVEIVSMLAETSICQALDTNEVVVVKVNIDRIKDVSTGNTTEVPGGIGSYTATLSSTPSSGIEVLAVHGVSPFDSPTFNYLTGVFSVDNVTSPIQADNTTVAEIVLRLTGGSLNSHDLTVTFQAIGAAGEPGLNVPEEHDNTITFLRGDADGDGKISMADAMSAAQFYVKVKTLEQLNALNAGNVKYDGSSGDKISMSDAMFIAQYYVKLRDDYFDLK
ncbi:FG-GAP-like repeat-containing protein [Chloroflexota bacterium]